MVTLFPPQQMQPMYATMPWAPPASDSQFPAWENRGFWMQCYPMPYPPHFQGVGSSRGPVFDRLKQPVHDQLGQHQSGQGQNPGPVRPSTPTGQTGLSRDRPMFVKFARNIVSRKRSTNQCQCKSILRRLQSRLCKLKMEKERLEMHKKDR